MKVMLVVCIILFMFTNSINNKQKYINLVFFNRIVVLSLIVTILLNINVLYFQSIGKGLSIYNDLFQVTILTQFIELILLVIAIFILFGWIINFSVAKQKKEEFNKINLIQDQYSLIAIFSILGGSLLMSSLDLLSMYLSIELQSFSLYILATLNKDKLSATSAGLKYFLLGSLSSCFILLGSAIVYNYTGLTHFESIHSLFSVFPLAPIASVGTEEVTYFANIGGSLTNNINYSIIIGLVIIILGFLFKVSAAPFYQWAPDVYDGTPTIVTVWLTIVAKLTIFAFLLELMDLPSYFSSATDITFGIYENNINISETIKNLLLISSLLSLIIGTVGGLNQIKIKRLLAFSSISHVGFLLLALGVYNQKSIDSFIFYLIQYSFTSLNIFLILLALGYLLKKHFITIYQPKTNNTTPVITNKLKLPEDLDINYLEELKGIINKNIILSFSLAICLFSMAGIPPLIGFFSKQVILFSSIENGYNFLSIVAILVSVISASYYLKIVKLIYFDSGEETNFDYLTKENSTWRNNLLGGQNLINKIKAKASFINQKQEISNIHSLTISVLTLLLLFFFINPSILLNGTQLISITIFNI